MFRQCKCGAKGGSCAPLRNAAIIPWTCPTCRQQNTVKRTTISATIISYRETYVCGRKIRLILKDTRPLGGTGRRIGLKIRS